MDRSRVLNIRDLLIIAVIGVVFGAVNSIYAAIDVAMIGLLGPLGSSITIGVFFIAPLLAMFIVRKPGAGILAGAILGVGEALMGNPWGVVTLIYGAIEGIMVEVAFLAFRYNRWDLAAMVIAGAVIAPLHYVYEYFAYGFSEFSVVYNAGTLLARIASGMVGGVLAYAIGKGLARTGVLSGFPIGKEEAERRTEAMA